MLIDVSGSDTGETTPSRSPRTNLPAPSATAAWLDTIPIPFASALSTTTLIATAIPTAALSATALALAAAALTAALATTTVTATPVAAAEPTATPAVAAARSICGRAVHRQHPRRPLQGHAEDRGAPSARSPTLHIYRPLSMPTYAPAARANHVWLSTRRRSALHTKTRCA